MSVQKCKLCKARSDAFGVYETCTAGGPSHEWEDYVESAAPVERKKVWACGACGKVAPTREAFSDSSCMTWGVEVWEDSIVYRSETDRRITHAVAVGAGA